MFFGEKKERKNLEGMKYLIKLNNVTFSAVSNFKQSGGSLTVVILSGYLLILKE